jgi:trimeric autotransporter adhesin
VVGDGGVGDGLPAADVDLRGPVGVAYDVVGNLYIADGEDHRVRRVDALTGLISTVAGNGTAGSSGDNGPAASASLSRPRDVAVDEHGNLYIADADNHRVRRVDARSGLITTVAGGGEVWGDCSPAVGA